MQKTIFYSMILIAIASCQISLELAAEAPRCGTGRLKCKDGTVFNYNCTKEKDECTPALPVDTERYCDNHQGVASDTGCR